MRQLAKFAAKVFCELIDKAPGRSYHIIKNKPHMPLVIGLLATGMSTDQGTADLYSFAYWTVEDQEMIIKQEFCFALIDERGDDPTAFEKVILMPYYCQDNGVELESHTMTSKRLSVKTENVQAQVCLMAEHWLADMYLKGYGQNFNCLLPY